MACPEKIFFEVPIYSAHDAASWHITPSGGMPSSGAELKHAA